MTEAPQGRLPPQNLDAERSVLGGILLDNTALPGVSDILQPADFYREAHRKVFEAMLSLSNDAEPIDRVTLKDALVARGTYEQAGGEDFIDLLDKIVPSASHLTYYAQIVQEKATARRVIEAAHAIVAQGYEQHGDVGEFLDDSAKRIDKIRQTAARTIDTKHESMKDFLARAFPVADYLDPTHRLLASGSVTLLQAAPGTGKTFLGYDAAFDAAAHGKRVLVIQAEGTGIGNQRRLARAEAAHAPISGEVRIWFRPKDFSLSDEHDVAALVRMAQGFDLVLLDSLSALAGDADENDPAEWRQVVEAIFQIRDAHGAAIFALHHTTKEAWPGRGAKPSMRNGRGHGVLVARADAVIELMPIQDQVAGLLRFTLHFVKQERDGEPRQPQEVEVLMSGDAATVTMQPAEPGTPTERRGRQHGSRERRDDALDGLITGKCGGEGKDPPMSKVKLAHVLHRNEKEVSQAVDRLVDDGTLHLVGGWKLFRKPPPPPPGGGSAEVPDLTSARKSASAPAYRRSGLAEVAPQQPLHLSKEEPPGDGDESNGLLRQVLLAWREIAADEAIPVREAIDRLQRSSALRAAFEKMGAFPPGAEKASCVTIGKYLARHKELWCGQMRFVAAGQDRTGAASWRVEVRP